MFIYLVQTHRDYEPGTLEAVCENFDVAKRVVEDLLRQNEASSLKPENIHPAYLGLGDTCVGEAIMWDVKRYRGPGDQITISCHPVSEK